MGHLPRHDHADLSRIESDLKSHQKSGCLQLSLLVTSTVLSAAALDTREAGLPITLTDNAHTESKMAEV